MSSVPTPPPILETGTYEIIRNRLRLHGDELRKRLEQLNQQRKDVFGSVETTLVGTDRIATSNNCIPRDIAAVGTRFLFGYNVHFGLRTETNVADVFAAYEFKEGGFREQPLELLASAAFERDFKEIHRYYKGVTFAQFFHAAPHLYMVFRVGKLVTDIKTFKWLVQGDRLTYIDNRSDHEVRLPPQHEFEWKRTHRDLHRFGQHPHITIEDRVFVETIGGDLTIKVENNTDSGQGIYSEPVDDKDQTLDDAEIHYATLGNLVLLKIRPYKEDAYRHLVFNGKTKQARRLDAIAQACVRLPDDHGLIFSNGYYLQNGEYKTFESGLADMVFERRLAAPNGEDFLYVFHNRDSGTKILLPYNVIEQQVDTPIICDGFAFFHAGELLCFKHQAEAQKHHALQVWKTPFAGHDFVPPAQTDSFLYKIGNRDIVRGMAECHELLALLAKDDTYADLYVDLVKLAGDVVDTYFWIDRPEAANLKEPLLEIRNAAAAAIDQFEKVVRVKQSTAKETARVQQRTREILSTIKHKRFEVVQDFVSSLADLRKSRGEIIALRDLRYAETAVIDAAEKEVASEGEKLAHGCVQFLLKPDALEPYRRRVADDAARIGQMQKVSDAKKLEETIATTASELELLIEIVSNLKIDDATHRTTIIDNISAIFGQVNQARAGLKGRIKELLSVEGVAEFAAQMKLLNQSVVNYLDVCDSPERCEEYLGKLMIQVEELEGRFAEFDEFVGQLTEKREEIYNALESRKLALIESRNKRANGLMSAAERILKGIKTRVESLKSIQEIHGYFAGDLMIEKVRELCGQLATLGDSVKVDDLQSRLKTIREDAVRQLKDKQELFADGDKVIKLGRHRFSVNVQQLDLTTVLRDGQMFLHLTGSKFFEPIDDAELLTARDLWEQEVVSESPTVYRSEYLAYCFLSDRASQEFLTSDEAARHGAVQRFMGPRYSEGYAKGVHDQDAVKLLLPLLEMQATLGLLRFDSRARTLATVWWRHFADKPTKTLLAAKLAGIGSVRQAFPASQANSGGDLENESPAATHKTPFGTDVHAHYVDDLRVPLATFVKSEPLFDEAFVNEAAEYLFHELVNGENFVTSRHAANLCEAFQAYLRQHKLVEPFALSTKSLHREPAACFRLMRDWLMAFCKLTPSASVTFLDEAAALLLSGKPAANILDGDTTCVISGFAGQHALITNGSYQLDFNRFMLKLARYQQCIVPRFERFLARKKELLDAARHSLRLDEFRPRVLTSFVRNKLIDTVYLPLIGDNLAKQIGAAGEQKRTDRMGLLLVLSPPGYGKTTLMEYVANRLGLIFMKINGPAIGHRVTSLDPVEAPNAAAREELAKLNLALEMGDNVMLYVDDIQHCHPEFLQKFISLCDAQRKIEGVYKGTTRTYDLRGRKFAVVMAGNPYTESGEKFQIPDMLANRADVYNLGEIIGESAEVFEMSYLENALTSNPVLGKIASRSQQDVYAIARMASQEKSEPVELEGNYSLEEINEFVATMRKLMQVRDVVLRVNREYIRSAAQSDDYRTEPPFKLQGSYRNMNRIAEKVMPIMNDAELQSLILSSYENDAQTLTNETEANLLKLKELLGIQTDVEKRRWTDIKQTFSQNVKLRGIDPGDQFGQAIVQLRSFGDGLYELRQSITEAAQHLNHRDHHAAAEQRLTERLDKLLTHIADVKTGLDAIPPALSTASAAPSPTPVTLQLAPVDPTVLDQKLIVQHKVPRSVLAVLTAQFEVMNQWLAPILATVNTQSDGIQQLHKSVEQCLQSYNDLLTEMRDANTNRRENT